MYTHICEQAHHTGYMYKENDFTFVAKSKTFISDKYYILQVLMEIHVRCTRFYTREINKHRGRGCNNRLPKWYFAVQIRIMQCYFNNDKQIGAVNLYT